MRRASLLVGLASAVACASAPVVPPPPSSPEECRSARLCSFNIFQFGAHEGERDYGALAEMLVQCDAIFVQEVRVKGGAEALERLARALGSFEHRLSRDTIPRSRFSGMLLSPPAGDGEAFGLLTRGSVAAESDLDFVDALDAETFARRPAAVRLRVGDLDLVVVSVHLSYGNKARRKAEVEALSRWLLTDPFGPEERDVLILGDFNRYAKGSSEFAILSRVAAEGRLRIPLEETLTRPELPRAARDEDGTTVGRKAHQYDQFVASAGLDRELVERPARLGSSVGVMPFDRAPRFAELPHGELSQRVSDHRPIWLKVCVDRGDDDP